MAANTRFSYRVQYYVPWPLAWGFPLAGIAIELLLTTHYVWGLSVSLISVLVLTTHYGIEIDMPGKFYREYLWILGWKNGIQNRFNQLEYLFINKSHISQKMNSRVSSYTDRRVEFNGYLKLDSDIKIHVANDTSKSKVVSKLSQMADDLKIELTDQTN